MRSTSTADWMMGKGGGVAGLGAVGSAPPLAEAYAVYLGLFAPMRASYGDPLAGFVDVLRDGGRDEAYSDEEWVAFLLPFAHGDEDAARDLWDGLLCQP
jgi:hypothetical protein